VLFRRAVPASAAWNVTKTLVQSTVLWTIALWVIPSAIVQVTRDMTGDVWRVGPWPRSGWLLFVLSSAGGLWSGWIMATQGRGTPLPLDHAREMVTGGPYAFVRNPMAIFGLGQGVGVALVLGSVAVLLYVAAGGAFWNWVLRPLEERRLLDQFGEGYERYRQHVRCWIPRVHLHRSAESTRNR